MADPVRNFAITTVDVAPSPASSGTTLTPDDAMLFPDPDAEGAFNVIVWPASEQPDSTNAEILRVTALAAGAWTIDRAEEGTDARSIDPGDQVMLGPTAKTITDLAAGGAVLKSVTDVSSAELLDLQNTPVVLAPAPGAGRFLVPIHTTVIYSHGTLSYSGDASLRYAGLGGDSEVGGSGLSQFLERQSDQVRWSSGIDNTDSSIPAADMEDLALVMEGNVVAGPILTHQLAAGGADYAVGDTGQLDTDNGVTYIVDTVDGLGAVLTYTLDLIGAAGVPFAPNDVATTTVGGGQPGIGTGFQVEVLTVATGDGDVRIALLYEVLEV
jgi:hypothetical protein